MTSESVKGHLAPEPPRPAARDGFSALATNLGGAKPWSHWADGGAPLPQARGVARRRSIRSTCRPVSSASAVPGRLGAGAVTSLCRSHDGTVAVQRWAWDDAATCL